MNTAIQCIILLACALICASTPILKCQCLRTAKAVKPSLISDVKVYQPRPYCNKKEVIVILKDRSSLCLDPNGNFTKAVLQKMEMQVLRVDKINTTNPTSTTPSATASATVSATSS